MAQLNRFALQLQAISIDVPASYSMQQKRSSQSLTLHHHASEHSNFFTIIGSQLTPLPRSDNPSQRTRTSFPLPTYVENINQCTHPDAPKPIHPDKEQICSSTLKLGTNIQFFSIRPFQERKQKNRNSIFPINSQTPSHRSSHTMVEMDGIEPTTPCLQSRCSTN
jgi:hypothetical protein